MSAIPINAPQPSGSPDDMPFTQPLDQIMAAYQGSGYAYFSGSDGGGGGNLVVNFQGLGQYKVRTESTVQWVHVVPEEPVYYATYAPIPPTQPPYVPPQVVTPEPIMVWMMLLFMVLVAGFRVWRKSTGT